MGTIPRFVRHVGIAAPFLRSDVESEVIAPVVAGGHIHDHGSHPPAPEPHQHPRNPGHHAGTHAVGQHAFEGLRYLPDGTENAEFILNQDPYRDASILIAGPNFGIGSMQAFAVTRLMACGVRTVIAPSFGPVFFEDCFIYGLLPVALSTDTISTIVTAIAANPRVPMTVDLERQVIERAGMKTIAFTMNPRLRANLLRGVDDLDAIKKHERDAESFQNENRRRRPWMYETGSDRP